MVKEVADVALGALGPRGNPVAVLTSRERNLTLLTQSAAAFVNAVDIASAHDVLQKGVIHAAKAHVAKCEDGGWLCLYVGAACVDAIAAEVGNDAKALVAEGIAAAMDECEQCHGTHTCRL